MASGSYDKTIHIWDVAAGKGKAVLRGHSAGVRALAFSLDGKTLASGSSDRTVRLWDLSTSKEKERLKGHKGGVRTVAYSADGKTLASAAEDSTIIVWDLATATEKTSLKPPNLNANVNNPFQSPPEVWALALSPKGKTLITGGLDNQVKVWDTTTGKLRTSLTGHSDAVTAVALAPDGSQVASGSYDRSIKIWRVSTVPMLPQVTLRGHYEFCIERDDLLAGRYIATCTPPGNNLFNPIKSLLL